MNEAKINIFFLDEIHVQDVDDSVRYDVQNFLGPWEAKLIELCTSSQGSLRFCTNFFQNAKNFCQEFGNLQINKISQLSMFSAECYKGNLSYFYKKDDMFCCFYVMKKPHWYLN